MRTKKVSSRQWPSSNLNLETWIGLYYGFVWSNTDRKIYLFLAIFYDYSASYIKCILRPLLYPPLYLQINKNYTGTYSIKYHIKTVAGYKIEEKK